MTESEKRLLGDLLINNDIVLLLENGNIFKMIGYLK